MNKVALLILTSIIMLVGCKPDDGPVTPPKDKPVYSLKETPYDFSKVPRILGNVKSRIPADNPLTLEKIALGKKLFYDPVLSRDYTISCASCHKPENAFADPAKVSVGVEGRLGTRNAPSLINMVLGKSFFWDGNTKTLEEQALIPIEADFEMDNTIEEVIRRLQADTTYERMFFEAFGHEPNADGMAKAIASFERILLSGNAKLDIFNNDRQNFRPTPSELRGLEIFFDHDRSECSHCHAAPLTFTDESIIDNGLPILGGDSGLALVTGNASDEGKFKTPTLRNLAFTAPYMHDGRFATLEEVIDHYTDGFVFRPGLDANIRKQKPLTDQEKADLIAFLNMLNEPEVTTNPEFLP
ncbi:MAG: cytochrome-c peroxidase [Bacteroidia bacterium]